MVYFFTCSLALKLLITSYSRVPNKRTDRLLENEKKKSHLYTLIQTYTFINFPKKVPPIRLFPPYYFLYFQGSIKNFSMAHFDLR